MEAERVFSAVNPKNQYNLFILLQIFKNKTLHCLWAHTYVINIFEVDKKEPIKFTTKISSGRKRKETELERERSWAAM